VSNPTATPEEHYAAICAAFLSHPDVTQPSDTVGSRKTFGSATLRIHNRIFAMLVRGKLVVKLPARRVDALIATGAGQRYEPGPGRLMKEWVSLDPSSADTWLPLAREAMEFVCRGSG
jgi:TfoX/Sxy family transcriptional regulator of competence genes